MARPVGAAHRPRLHAHVDRRGPRRGTRARDDRGGGRSRHHGLRHRAVVRRTTRRSSATTRARCGLYAVGRRRDARIVTKGGMARTAARGSRTVARARSAPTARRAWRLSTASRSTSISSTRRSAHAVADLGARAARLVEDGLVKRVGLANVNRRQLDEALELAPIAAVQVALSPFDDARFRGGVVERCAELGIAVIAHSPLGGPRRAAGSLARGAGRVSRTRRTRLRPRWRSRGCSTSRPDVVAIPGARRPETALARPPRCDARARPERARRARARVRRALRPARAASAARRRRGRGRDGHPRSR